MKKFVLILMVLVSTLGYTQNWIDLEMPDFTGVQNGETVVVPVTCSDIVIPHEIASFFIYIEWDATVLQYESNALSPEMAGYVSPFAAFYVGNPNTNVPPDAFVGSWVNLAFAQTFSMVATDVFFNVTFTYIGDGTTGTNIDFQFAKSDQGGKLSKGVTEILDETGAPFTINTTSGSVNMVAPSANTWQGDDATLPDDWFTAANWSDNVVPGSGDDALIPASAAAYPYITGNGNEGMVNNLEVEAGVVLSVGVQAGLTVSGNLLCDGTLSLETDATGNSGSFICDGTISGAGFFEMFRDVVCYGNGEPEGDWHYLSSPVDGFTNYSMYDYFVNTWDQAGGEWQHLMGDPTIPCDPAPETALLYDATHLDAFAINWDENYLPDCNTAYPGTGNMINFYGPITDLHNGSYSAAAGFGAGSYQEWNMFGNPYPSSIDITAVTWGAGVVEGAALWDACADNYIYINTTTNPGFIPPTNGFFIQTTVAGTFSLDGSERAHDGTTTFYKDDQSGLLILEASGIGGSDKLYVHFMEGVTGGFDTQGDFHKLISTAQGLPQIYTTISQEKLAINARPEIDMLPMGFQSVSTGNYTIAAVETSEFTEIYLEDLVTGTITNLMTSDYSFDYTEGEASNRFMIHFGPLGVDDNLLGNISIWSSENKVYVELPKEISGEIMILNMMGQEVMSTDTQPGINVIPLSEVNTYYVVKVVSNKQVITGKVYIK